MSFILNNKKTIFGFLFIIVMGFFCLSMAHWQWQRYLEKKEILAHSQQPLAQEMLTWAQIQRLPEPQYQWLRVQGQYLNQWTMLLSKLNESGQSGFEVFTPLTVVENKRDVHSSQEQHSNAPPRILLVDRGWIGTGSKADALQPVQGLVMQSGLIKRPKYAFILGENVLSKSFPYVIQRIQIKELQALTRLTLFTEILQLASDQPHGFVRKFSVATVSPQRHLMYVGQWLLLAIVLWGGGVILYRHH